jgi:cobyrinic acid a,c-diamide synthase
MTTSTVDVPRLVIAGVSSGVGKTTVTVALARALRARGIRPALFKCGPDYLDPTYHARAASLPSQNLDGWMMGKDAVLTTFGYATRDADVALIEGMMGLFDGAGPTGDQGSTAEIAKWLEAPVLLVVDAGAMARSIAAVVQGFDSFDPGLHIAAAIANRIGGPGHLELLRSAQKTPPVLGGLPSDPEHAFPERHLGLLTATESTPSDACLDRWGSLASEGFALEALMEIARSAPSLALPLPLPQDPCPLAHDCPLPENEEADASAFARRRTCRIGLAKDGAFHFYYADNLRRLEALGAELVPFSPVKDNVLPAVDGVYLGGGYPESFARELAANTPMREQVHAFVHRGGAVYAECGGLMYLAQAIVTTEQERHPMVGVLPAEVRVHPKLQAIGYVEVETQMETVLGPRGTRFRGHQFRYSDLVEPPAERARSESANGALGRPDVLGADRVYSVRKRRGGDTALEGYRIKNTVASYVHAHWASNPKVPAAFVRACERSRSESRS